MIGSALFAGAVGALAFSERWNALEDVRRLNDQVATIEALQMADRAKIEDLLISQDRIRLRIDTIYVRVGELYCGEFPARCVVRPTF